MTYAVTLPRLGTYQAWRDAARALATNGMPADAVTWTLEDGPKGLFDAAADPLPAVGSKVVNVPKAFPTLAKQALCNRAEDTFDLMYQVLLKVSTTPDALNNRAAPLVQKAHERAKNVRRDRHKMRAFVRFREVEGAGSRRAFVAWFEPDHRIEELNASFFARRFADMDWAIITPEVTTTFHQGALEFKAVTSTDPNLQDETEGLWRTYYANTFNPARLKVKAMQSEMPKKYWKNLPEADLIPGMIAQAEARVRQMQATAPTLPPLRAERILSQQKGDTDQPPESPAITPRSSANPRKRPISG